MLKLDNDINLRRLGNTVAIAGVLLIDDQTKDSSLLLYPSRTEEIPEHDIQRLTLPEWEKVLRQLDLVETEVLEQAEDGKMAKKIVRKCQRAIEGHVSWAVYKRDNYTCRYCGKTGIPLSVDHVDLWEHGGASVELNLITACKKCNRTRGNMPYEEWLKSDEYGQCSINLSPEDKKVNRRVVDLLPKLKSLRRITKRKR